MARSIDDLECRIAVITADYGASNHVPIGAPMPVFFRKMGVTGNHPSQLLGITLHGFPQTPAVIVCVTLWIPIPKVFYYPLLGEYWNMCA